MKTNNICIGTDSVTIGIKDTTAFSNRNYRRVWKSYPNRSVAVGLGYSYGEKQPVKGIQSIRMKCPRCGRRVMSSIKVCEDGCCTTHSIPPHKIKMWWKKSRKNGVVLEKQKREKVK